ncbi:MAG: hypothetical protein KJ799_07395 [Bacteroidetes bacterium]|nr:hypothetical protein [Bacteroidota bacterium]MBU2506533.1 hypothetical protein [Bacteroidota bacterium]
MKKFLFVVILYLPSLVFSQVWPFDSNADVISSTFGSRQWNGYDFHNGIDIACTTNTEVTVSKSGIFMGVWDASPYLENVKISNDDGTYSMYMHITAESGFIDGVTPVDEGLDVIGTTNLTHLHLESRTQLEASPSSFHPLNDLDYSNEWNSISVLDDEIKTDSKGSYVEVECHGSKQFPIKKEKRS